MRGNNRVVDFLWAYAMAIVLVFGVWFVYMSCTTKNFKYDWVKDVATWEDDNGRKFVKDPLGRTRQVKP